MGLLIQFASEGCEALRLCLAQLLMCNMALHQFEVLRLMSSACILFLMVGVWLLEWRRFLDNRAWTRVVAHPHWYLAAGAKPLVLAACAFPASVYQGHQTPVCKCKPGSLWAAKGSKTVLGTHAHNHSILSSARDHSAAALDESTDQRQSSAASLGFLLNVLAFAVIKLTGSLTQKVLGTVKNILLVFFQVLFMGESITARQWAGYQVSLLGFVWYQYQKITAARAGKGPHDAQQAALPCPKHRHPDSTWGVLTSRFSQDRAMQKV